MGVLARKPYREVSGLTLIEVLIALAIVSIALTAVIKASTQSIRGTGYLETKTIAMWVGTEIMNEARLNLIPVDSQAGNKRGETTMLNRDWYWQVTKEETPNSQIDKLNVNVFESEDEEASPIISLESYVYRE